MKNHSVKRGGAFAFAEQFTALLFILLLLFTSLSAKAQVPKQSTTTVLSGYVMNQGSTSNLFGPLYIDTSKSKDITFSAQMLVSAGDATNGALFFAPSADGITMDTNHPIVVYCAPIVQNSTNFNWYVTNVTGIGACQGYFLYQITNGTQLSSVTNTLKVSLKISTP